ARPVVVAHRDRSAFDLVPGRLELRHRFPRRHDGAREVPAADDGDADPGRAHEPGTARGARAERRARPHRVPGPRARTQRRTKVADAIKSGLNAKFGEGAFDVLRVETVGPKVGHDLWRDATLAVIFSTLVMGAYIAFRFDWRFGVGAAVALVHDVLMTLGAL